MDMDPADPLILTPAVERTDMAPFLYFGGFEHLNNWISLSLDKYKPELASLVFPVLVHCYLGLIRASCNSDAIKLLDLWRDDNNDKYVDEIGRLATITSANILSNSKDPFIIAVCTSVFRIRISQVCYELLLLFVHNESPLMTGVLSILNKYIHCDLHSGPPSSLYVTADLDGYTVRDMIEKLVLPEILAISSSGGGGSGNSTIQSTTTTTNTSNTTNTTTDKTDTSTATATVMGEGDGEGDGVNGDPLHPCILFATVANTMDDMTCMTLNSAVTQAVAGFRDGCIRAWCLDPTDTESPVVMARRNKPSRIQEVLPKPNTNTTTYRKSNNTNSNNNNNMEGGDSSDNKQQQQQQQWDYYQSYYYPLLELRGHSQGIYGVSQSNDTTRGGGGGGGGGRLILSTGGDNTIRLWDLGVAGCVGVYEGGLGLAWDVSFGPLGGYYFLTAHRSGLAAVFATDRPVPLRLLSGHLSDVSCCVWHGNATLMLTGSDDRTARLWDLRTGGCVRVLGGAASPVGCVAVSGDGHVAAAGCEDGTVLVWDLVSGRSAAVLSGHKQSVHTVSFSSQDKVLYSGGSDCSVRTWDVSSIPCLTTREGGSGIRTTTTTSSPLLLSPYNTFYTKNTPVYCLGVTREDMVYVGGPFSMSTSTSET
eukprot:gene9870-20535_t